MKFESRQRELSPPVFTRLRPETPAGQPGSCSPPTSRVTPSVDRFVEQM